MRSLTATLVGLVLIFLAACAAAQTQTRSLALAPGIRAEAAEIGRGLVRSGSDAQLGSFMRRIQAENPHGNIMEVLFLVFRESIEATNEDKKYFLEKLKMYNDMSEALSDYLSQLMDEAGDIGRRAAAEGRGGGSGSNGGCGADDVNETTIRLDHAASQVEAQIAKLPPEARSSSDVQQLSRSLRRDRQLIALARRHLLAVASRPGAGQSPKASPRPPAEATPKLQTQPIPQPQLRVKPPEPADKDD